MVVNNRSVLYSEDICYPLMTGDQPDTERHRGTTGKAIILGQVNGLFRDFLHPKGPKHTGDGKEDLGLGISCTWADSSTTNDLHQMGCTRHVVTHPAPKVQWSRAIGSARLVDSAAVVWSSMYRSGYHGPGV